MGKYFIGPSKNKRRPRLSYRIIFFSRIRKDCGHGFYDVEYGPESFFPREAGVSLDRIMPLVTSFRMKAFGEFKFPVINIPVKHRDKMIGVIGMDTFEGVLHAPYDPQPEPGLKLFLEHLVC